jgi:NADH-quinone oxidoreductase subunit G
MDDKAANRKGLELLEIDQDENRFLEGLNDADLFVNFNNDLFRTGSDEKVKALLKSTARISVCSHDYEVFRRSDVILPSASYSEYGGTIISEQGILQKFEKAVFKDADPKDVLEITRLLGGAITDANRAWKGIRQSIEALADVEPEKIPAEGLNLAASEAENVSA